MEVIIYQKKKHSNLTQKQMELYMNGRLNLEAKSYPYNKVSSNPVKVEIDTIYYKPVLEINGSTLLTFETTDDMIECLIELYNQYPNLTVINR